MIKDIINPVKQPVRAYVGSQLVWEYFNPSHLFKNGEEGVWFDPSDLSTLYQDVNGTTPVTKDGDPVGLMLDKSQGVYKNSFSLQHPLNQLDDEDAGVISKVPEGTYFNLKSPSTKTQFNVPVNIGSTYKVDITYTGIKGGMQWILGNLSIDPLGTRLLVGDRVKATFIFKALKTTVYPRLSWEGTIHEVVFTEIVGNHATQSTAASRPIYRTDGKLHWLEFDGVDDCLKTNDFDLKQPTQIVLALSTPTYTNEFFDGSRTNICSISSNYIGNTRLYAGAGGDYVPPKITLNKNMLFTALANGVNSFLKIDNQPPYFKDAGSSNPNGVTLMRLGNSNYYGKGSIYAVIAVNKVLLENEVQKIESYAKNKAGLPL